MIDPEVIDAMIAAGASAEVLAAAWKADLAKQEAKITEKRAKDAERQRRHRESRDVTVTACDSVTKALSPLAPPKVSPEPLSNNPPISPKPATESARAKRLTDDWQPNPLSGKASAMVALWQAGEVERELAKFRNYWLAKGGKEAVKTDWQRTWINWLISADERKPRDGHQRTNGMGRHQSPDGISSTARAGLAVFGEDSACH